MSIYQIYLNDAAGNHLAFLDEGRILSLHIAQAENAVGVLQMTMPDTFPFGYLMQDGQVEIWRTSDGGVTELLLDQRWLIVDFAKSFDGGTRTYYLEAHSGNDLLDRSEVEYAAGSTQASKTNVYLDDVQKLVVSDNMGATVTDATRKSYNPPVAIQANASAAPQDSKDFAKQRLLSLCQEFCNMSAGDGTNLFFDTIWNQSLGSFEFRTYTGQRGADLSSGNNQIVFSVENVNLTKARVEYDFRNERNWVYVGGQDTEANRHIKDAKDVTRITKSPYNRREAFINSTHTLATDDAALQAEANAALWQYRPLKIFTGTILNTPACDFGTHWHFGDKVIGALDDDTFICHINSITIDLGQGREDIAPALRSVTA